MKREEDARAELERMDEESRPFNKAAKLRRRAQDQELGDPSSPQSTLNLNRPSFQRAYPQKCKDGIWRNI